MRTVKYRSFPLNNNKRIALEILCQSYADEKDDWLERLRNWDYQFLLDAPRKIRDDWVKKGYKSRHGLQARHWKLALQDAIETWDKYWQTCFTTVRSKISKYKGMSDAERHYAYWLLKGYAQFTELMQGKDPTPTFEIATSARHKIAGYVQRTVKRLRGKNPIVTKVRSAKFDADCYEVFENQGRQYIKLMSKERGKRIAVPLSGKGKIEGNITVVLAKDYLDVHVTQQLKPRTGKDGPVEAVDFGYTEVMTDTQGNVYGKRFGQKLTKTSQELHKKMQKRHKIHAIQKKELAGDRKKSKRLLKFNLGRQKLQEKKRATRASLEQEINTGINELLKSKSPSLLITEDLRHLFTYKKSKAMNRKLSSWLRGRISDRIAFKALVEGFHHEQVNPAYGSQTCLCCDFVDSRNRSYDMFKCIYCGHEDKADRVAAVNYARRYGDQEIGLYTPHSQVKTILLARFHRRLETGQPVTVQGRTLETVSKVHPPPSCDDEKCVIPVEIVLEDRAVTQRAKQNKHVLIRFNTFLRTGKPSKV